MKIALGTFGSRGEIQPMIALAIGLKEKGYSPILCTSENYRYLADKYNIPFHIVGKDFKSILSGKNALEAAHELIKKSVDFTKSLEFMINDLKNEINNQFNNMNEIVRGCDLILGMGTQFASYSLAEKYNKPYKFITTTPYSIPSFTNNNITSISNNPLEIQKQSIWLMKWGMTLVNQINMNRVNLGLKPILDVMDYLIPRKLILASFPEISPLPNNLNYQVTQVGYFKLNEKTKLPNDLKEFIEKGEKPIYIGLGSRMPDINEINTTNLLFEAVKKAHVRAIITKGWTNIESKNVPEYIKLIDEVDFFELFPKVSMVIQHGGGGTITVASMCGTPQISVPHAVDHFYWTNRIFELGLSPKPIPHYELTSEILAKKILEVKNNNSYLIKSKELSKKLNEYNGIEDTINLLIKK